MPLAQNVFTQKQVEALAVAAGFLPDNSKIAAAIAMCEAPYMVGGIAHSNFTAVGDQHLANDVWGYSYGGYQVRSLRAQKGTGGWRDETRLLDPLFNTKAARQIKLAQGWNAWTTYRTGIYKAYMQDKYPAPAGSYIVVSGDTLSGVAQKFTGFTWQELAKANGLQAPYTIHIGQLLLLPYTVTGV